MRFLQLLLVVVLVFSMGCAGASAPEGTDAPRSAAKEAAGGRGTKDRGDAEKFQVIQLNPGQPGGQAPEKAREPEQQPEVARKIIYTADIEVVVEKFEDAEQRIRQLVKEFKGYVSKSEVTGSPGSRRHGHWTARIPVDQFDAFRDAIAGLGELHRNSLDSRDVTEEYYDLEANIKNKQVEEERLREHLKKSTGNLKDILAVEEQLSRVRGEIERQQGRLNYLARLTALTTVTIAVQERKDYVAPTSPSFGTSVGRTFEGSVAALAEFGKAIVIAVVALVPWIPVIALVVVPAWLLIRRWQWRGNIGLSEPRSVLPVEPPPAHSSG